MRLFLLIFLNFFASILWAAPSCALDNPKEMLAKIGVDSKLGASIDLSAEFLDSDGKPVKLQDLVAQKGATIITPVYYSCPRLCGMLMKGLADLINGMDLRLGEDFTIISISFDHTEGPADAAKRAEEFRAQVSDHVGDRARWHFLTGPEPTVSAVMNQLGFKYIPDHDEFAHAPVIMLLTPAGKIAQFFTGVTFSASDVRLALVEASEGQIGTMLDQVMLYCFAFDPTLGKYSWAAWNVMRLGGVLTLLVLGTIIYWAARKPSETTDGKPAAQP